jgi:hypothetical protein
MYKILGSDGVEYDSIPTEKIKQWIRENRVDKKTPVMPEDAEDWVFLGALPEFAEIFAASQKPADGVSTKKSRGRMLVWLGLFLLVVAAAILIFSKMKHH